MFLAPPEADRTQLSVTGVCDVIFFCDMDWPQASGDNMTTVNTAVAICVFMLRFYQCGGMLSCAKLFCIFFLFVVDGR